jgi:hypothetical protein
MQLILEWPILRSTNLQLIEHGSTIIKLKYLQTTERQHREYIAYSHDLIPIYTCLVDAKGLMGICKFVEKHGVYYR